MQRIFVRYNLDRWALFFGFFLLFAFLLLSPDLTFASEGGRRWGRGTVASTGKTLTAATAPGEETHTPILKEPTQSRTDEKPVDPESEVAAFRDRDKKST